MTQLAKYVCCEQVSLTGLCSDRPDTGWVVAMLTVLFGSSRDVPFYFFACKNTY